MIFEADIEGPDQMRGRAGWARPRCPHMPEDTFSHGAVLLMFSDFS